MLTLVKHYLDAVTPDGDVTIVYDSSLGMLGSLLRFEYSSRLHSSPDGSVQIDELAEPARVGGLSGEPARQGARPAIISVHLANGFSGDWIVRQPGRQPVCLLDEPGAFGRRIEWHCRAPVCDVVLPGVQGAAAGYVETLRMQAPWPSIPIDRLHWGRFIGGDRSLVWIVWEGRHPRRLAWLDGEAVPLSAFASAPGAGLSIASGQLRLEAAHRREVVRARIDGRLARAMGPLRRLLPRVVRGIVESKSLASGILTFPDGATIAGFALHETIEFGGAA